MAIISKGRTGVPARRVVRYPEYGDTRPALFLRAIWFALLLLLSLPPVVQGADAPGARAELPEFALARLSIARLDRSLEKTGAYADRLYANSGVLARNIIANTLFSSIPLGKGFKKDAPAQLFYLDPLATGLRGEIAWVLPVSDAAIVKSDLLKTFGQPVDKDGVMAFTLPQPLPAPDKTLLVKLESGRLLAAPDRHVLRKLADLAEPLPHAASPTGRDAGATAALGDSPDAVLTVKVEPLRQLFGDTLATSMSWAASHAAEDREQARRLRAQIDALFESLWQIEHLQAEVEFDAAGENAALSLAALPRRGSQLAALFLKFDSTIDASLPGRLALPAGEAAQVVWRMSGREIARLLRPAKPTGEAAPAGGIAGVLEALADLLAESNGDAGLALGNNAQGKFAGVLALGVAEPAAAEPKIEALLRTVAGLYSNGAATVASRACAAAEGKVALREYKLEVAGLADLDLGPLERLKSQWGWPIGLYQASDAPYTLLALGEAGPQALQDFVSRPKGEPTAPNAPNGTMPNIFLSAQLSPVGLLDLFLSSKLASVDPEEAKAITAGLSTLPVRLTLWQSGGVLNLRANIPAGTARALMVLRNRFERLSALLNDGQPGGDTPAPPPPK